MKLSMSALLFIFLAASCGSVIHQHPTPTPIRQPTTATSTCPITSTVAPGVHNLQDLLPGCDYAAWFEDNTGYAPDPRYFGDYAVMPWGNDLYLGFGKARPAESNGALFAKYQSNSIDAIYQPSEQGFIDMTKDVDGQHLHIPGPDPTDPANGGHQWDWGNTYVYTPTAGTQVLKHRNLPNVIHTWGMESDSTGLYTAVSSHTGDYETWTGEVFRSTDMGETWTRIADKDDSVGDYRTYDIIKFNNKFYVTWNDEYGKACGLAESADLGVTWQRISLFNERTNCRTRLFIYDNKLLALAAARDGLLALHTDGSVTAHLFPDFKAQTWLYNPFAIDTSNRLYIVTEAGQIKRTSDMSNWETVVASDREFFTLSYWPQQDKIVVADRGLVGRLWLLAPATSAITPPAPPSPTISLSGNDVMLQWPAQTGMTYRVYRKDDDAYTVLSLQDLQIEQSGTTWTDANAATQLNGTYYQVRSKNSAGDISAPSRMLGKFTYPLTPGD